MGGILGFDSKKTDTSQRYTDQRAAASENSGIAYGQDSSYAGGNVFAVRDESNLQITDQSQSNYSYNDPEIAKNALNQQRKVVDSFLDAFRQKDATLATLLEDKTTGGETRRNSALLVVTLAVLVLVGWIFYRR